MFSEAEITAAISVVATITPPCKRDAGAYPDGDDPHLYVGVSPHSIAGAGKLAENMEAAGSDRRSISKIVLSHAHPDHLWGLLDDFDNTPMFPNAPI
jgi:glyoxylase-like metal-dependent hydrolase (beta-lactamase superfamily II)